MTEKHHVNFTENVEKCLTNHTEASDNHSMLSGVENPRKLEEDVRFPMEQHLMQEGPSVCVEELDALNGPKSDCQYQEKGPHSRRFALTTGISDTPVTATSLSALIEENRSFSTLLSGGSGVWWLDCYNASESEIRVLARTFDVHPLTTEDVVSQDPLEKFEMFKNYVFIAYKTFVVHPDTEELESVCFYLIVFRTGVLSFQMGLPTSHGDRVRVRMRQLHDWVKVSPVWVCYALLDDITDSFEPVMKWIETQAGFVEHAVFVDNGTSEIALLLGRLGEARQRTMVLMRFLYGKTDVVRGFIQAVEEPTSKVVTSDMGLYLGDIQNRLNSMKENLMSYESILSRSHNSYMGILQVEYVNSNTRMTTLLGKVTIIGTVLIPINLVFGAWGMNVPVPGQDSEGLGWFFGIVGVICFLVVVFFVASWLYLQKVQHVKRSNTFI